MPPDPEYFVERSATFKNDDGSPSARKLSAWRNLDAYVLLGEPGAGKSTAFEQEAKAIGSDARYVTARSLLALGAPDGWTNEILFIDALDERRGDSSAFLSSLDELRQKLNQLGRPRFRLSCREADWYINGVAELAEVAPAGKVTTLWLDPLTSEDVKSLLEHWSPQRVADPRVFLERAQQHGMTSLLGNPLLLGMLVDAVSGSDWPSSRQATYELACEKMAVEHNDIRRRSTASSPVLAHDILSAAGQLYALMLLSDAHGFTMDPADDEKGVIPFTALPTEFARSTRTASECLSSKLFIADGDRRIPRHRTVAEFLAAKALAQSIDRGLPVQRVLAMMCGRSGRIVEPLRGLYAWLAVHCIRERPYLIDRDALGLVMYGDVRHFSVPEKRGILDALYREAERFRWFRNENWDAHPFGALGTRDMEQTFRGLLTSTAREPAHQALLDCVTDAIAQGERELQLPKELEHVTRDSSYWSDLRRSALDAWLTKGGYDINAAKRLLEDIRAGAVADEDDQLAGALLTALYPAHMSTAEALRYQRPRRQEFNITRFHMFWALDFLAVMPKADLPAAADVLAARLASEKHNSDEEGPDRARDETRELALKVVAAALRADTPGLSAERLYAWLGVGVDEYGSFEASSDEAKAIAEWLSNHPAQRRQAFAYGLSQVVPEARDGRRYFWVVEERMFRSRRAENWFQWLLEIADATDDPEVAKHCLQEAGRAALGEMQDSAITVEEIEDWVRLHLAQWPLAEQWKTDVFAWPLDAYQSANYARKQKQRSKAAAERSARQQQLAPHLAAISTGLANPRLLDQVVNAYAKRYTDVRGETPLERVQDFLVVGPEQASQAIEGIKAALARTDLPSVDDVALTLAEGKILYLNSVCLLAAKLVHEEQPDAWRSWPAALVDTMIAFCLTGVESESPSWYAALANEHPQVLAPILLRFARTDLSRGVGPQLRQLYTLRDQGASAELVQLVVPELWRILPSRPSAGQLRFLESVILPASMLHLEQRQWHSLVEDKLAEPGISDELAIVLHVAAMRFDVAAHCHVLLNLCEHNPDLTNTLGDALMSWRRDETALLADSPELIGRLVALLASGLSSERPTEADTISSSDSRREAAQTLIRAIASATSEVAGSELRRLRDLPALSNWAVYIDSLLYDHERIANKASFLAASPALVAQVLLNKAPANARDMAELVRDHMRQLAQRIQFEESNWIENFYRPVAMRTVGRSGTGKGPKATQPKIENDCRDLIQGLLRDRVLLLNVQVEKESYAAGDRRADLQATTIADGRRVIVPIEVKKDDHPEVWTAWRDQLAARYTSNPAAEGMGVYLVLWFGYRSTRAPDGVKPKSAEHMASLLDALIPAERRAHIVGLVVDLSRDLQ
ncbi:NACHT domain-containing protein [Variovorax sp. ZT5P49]|uniref:NACHT domain-containing protein n=1 Tax=Variovorax sp. ZT5P49 TaxID=3443733 RepID=UPI003F45A8F2